MKKEMKTCPRCKLEFPKDKWKRRFAKTRGYWYYDAYCPDCMHAYHEEWKKVDKKRNRAINDEKKKLIDSGFKLCSRCGIIKPLREYTKQNNGGAGGVTAHCKECARLAYHKNPDHRWVKHIKIKYGLSIDDFNSIMKRQNGVCAICGTEATNTKNGSLFVDHDHATGEVRGLLCTTCNTGLGAFKDNPVLIDVARHYLVMHFLKMGVMKGDAA